MTDFKIPPYFLRIIKEADTRNSDDINKAIRFLISRLDKQEEFEEFKKKIEKLKKNPDKQKKEKKEKYFIEYLNKDFLKQKT